MWDFTTLSTFATVMWHLQHAVDLLQKGLQHFDYMRCTFFLIKSQHRLQKQSLALVNDPKTQRQYMSLTWNLRNVLLSKAGILTNTKFAWVWWLLNSDLLGVNAFSGAKVIALTSIWYGMQQIVLHSFSGRFAHIQKYRFRRLV